MSYPVIQFMRPIEAAGGGIEFKKADKQINSPEKLTGLINDIGSDVWFMSEKAREGTSGETMAVFLEYTAGAIAFVSAVLEKENH